MATGPLFKTMDITGKFNITIITGLVVLFTLVAWLMLTQQRAALHHQTNNAESILKETIEGNNRTSKDRENAKIQQMIAILQQIAPSPVADLEISTLERYADVMIQDPNLSYIGFFDIDGNVLSQTGNKNNVNAENLITKNLVVEEMKMGSMTIGYNFDRLDNYIKKSTQRKTEILNEMDRATDDSLQTALWSMVTIFVIMSIAVAVMVSTLFHNIVIKRLSDLEHRMHDIAEGEGDLRQRVDVANDDIIGRVGTHFNAFVSKMHSTIQQVVTATDKLTSSSEQMNLITEQSRDDINQQKSDIELAVTAITQMSSTVQEVARSAATAAESAQNADEESKNGMRVVNFTTESIGALADEVDRAADVIQKLEEDSNAIGVVLDVIRGIAEQTNLLALNAAIEAARAGEQGRGFAVVADEVRTLASRTQQSTQEIQEMIEKLQTGTNNAVSVMESSRSRAKQCVTQATEAGISLKTITNSVAIISDMTIQIASAAEEQGSVSEEINRNIVAVHEVAGKSADGVEQTAYASMELSQLSSELRDLIKTFKV